MKSFIRSAKHGLPYYLRNFNLLFFTTGMAKPESLFIVKPQYDFSNTTEEVITALQVKAHVNNKLHSRVPSLLVVTNRRLIIYRTSSVKAYWVQLILSSTVGLIPVLGFVFSFIVEKLIEGVVAIYRTLTRTPDKERERLYNASTNDLIVNTYQWPITFQKDIQTLAAELKCIRIRNAWPRILLLDTKSNLKSFRYPYIKYLAPEHAVLLALEIKVKEKELGRWFTITEEMGEITLVPQ